MISPEERRLLHWLASVYYEGRGEIVDLGCFVGVDPVVLADGLARNARRDEFPKRPLIHAFDNFEAVEGGDPTFKTEGSLLVEYAANVAPFRDRICTYAGDLFAYGWPNRPIEILFNDVSKSVELNAHVIGTFFPHLIPGRSVLIQQDYYDDHFWVAVSMEKLAPYFEKFAGPVGGTSAYLNIAPIPVRDLKAAGLVRWTTDRRHIRAVRSRHLGWHRYLFRLSEARMAISGRDVAAARAILDEVKTHSGEHRALARRIERVERGLARISRGE